MIAATVTATATATAATTTAQTTAPAGTTATVPAARPATTTARTPAGRHNTQQTDTGPNDPYNLPPPSSSVLGRPNADLFAGISEELHRTIRAEVRDETMFLVRLAFASK